jgi:plastocyanin
MAMNERKRLIFTAIAIALVGIVTGLLLGGGLLPSRAEGQLYAEKVTTTTTVTDVVHAHDDYPQQHTHTITTEVTTTETTPHGYFHDLATTIASGTTGSASTPKQAANDVAAWDNYFTPASIIVPVGTTVTWTNVGFELHTVTTYTDLFSLDLAFGDSLSYTFNEPGTYTYFCIPHESEDMTGKVIVE